MAKVPQLRKGLTREDLLEGTWVGAVLKGEGDWASYGSLNPQERDDLEACLPLLDYLIGQVASGRRFSRRDLTGFFTTVERFCAIRSVITERMAKGELTPSLLDELVK